MRLGFFILFMVTFACSCKKYKDTPPITDPRINNPYCNDPAAVNYNWGFPGIPDNSVCIYPADIFTGNYIFRDSVYNTNNTIAYRDTFALQISKADSTKIFITGFCGVLQIQAKANRYYSFNIDSLVSKGQVFCNTTDTISGKGEINFLGDSLLKFNYQILTDSGFIYHTGSALKQ